MVQNVTDLKTTWLGDTISRILHQDLKAKELQTANATLRYIISWQVLNNNSCTFMVVTFIIITLLQSKKLKCLHEETDLICIKCNHGYPSVLRNTYDFNTDQTCVKIRHLIQCYIWNLYIHLSYDPSIKRPKVDWILSG